MISVTKINGRYVLSINNQYVSSADDVAKLNFNQIEMLLVDVREYLLNHVTDKCFDTGCTCEGNQDSKSLMDRIEAIINKTK